MTTTNLHIAELMIRVIAGILFLFQGYDKLFGIKIQGVIDFFRADTQKNHIPAGLLTGMAYYTSYVEFFGGLFLLAGFCTDYALYALAVDLILVSIAFSFVEPMWDMKHVFPRLVLTATSLLLPPDYRTICVDHLIQLN